MKSWLLRILPWLITAVALYYAFSGIDWVVLLSHLGSADPSWLLAAILLTCFSYLFRARRWQFLFPSRILSFPQSAKVLILGFFMNNVLPARAGELVRAHLGSQVSHEKRTLVLATIASERLADGLMLSVMFVLFAIGIGDQAYSNNLLYVALLFGIAAAGVVAVLVFREYVFAVAEKLHARFDSRGSAYTLDRLKVFINGLAPLFEKTKVMKITLWSVVIWSTELAVYVAVLNAYGANTSLSYSVLFLVAVNFSSLVPAAPGGFGVIEAIASAVLVSIGIEKEHALSMVFSQHLIQYLVVGVPGLIIMFSWKAKLDEMKRAEYDERQARPA